MNASTGDPAKVNKDGQVSGEALDWLLSLQKNLPRLISGGKGLSEVVSLLFRKSGCCTVLEDSSFSVLTASGFSETDALKKRHLSMKTDLNAKTQTPKRGEPQLFFTKRQDGDATVNRASMALASGREPLGYLSLLKIGEEFTEQETSLLEHTADCAAALLACDKRIAEMELRLKGDFIDDLLNENRLDAESIRNRARALEYDISAPHRVLVADFDDMKQFTSHNKGDLKSDLVKRIHGLTALHAESMAAFKGNELIILVRDDAPSAHSYDEIRRLAEALIEDTAPLLKSKMYVGIGNVCTGLSDYRESYLCAKKALEIGKYMITEGQVHSLEKFKTHALFLSTVKPDELYHYAKDQLGPLLDYDKKHRSELIKTLQEFLYLRNHVEETARSLNMSVSGLKYRLSKIEKILGHPLKDNKVSFDLQLALVILQLFGEYTVQDTP